MKNTLKILSVLMLLFSFMNPEARAEKNTAFSFADTAKTYKVFVFDIMESIAPPVVHKTKKAFKQAKDTAADLILIHMNTYGGLLDAADSIRTAILESKIPVWVFIDNNAASAGALISIACDSIYMRPGASIGAATVVNQSGEALPDKYQSYMRAMMRSTAETKGRDPRIAEGMVDPRIFIPGVTDSGRVITFTASEAIKNRYCEGTAESLKEVLKVAGLKHYRMIRHEITAADRIIGFLVNPIVSGILIMIIIGGIYFELQTPGVGFPLAASVIAALLYFAPLYIEGLAANWEIIIFIIGVILIAVEIFAIPGFGVTGISGIILVVVGLTLSMVHNFHFEAPGRFPFDELIKAFFTVIIAAFVSLLLSFYISRKLFTTTVFGQLALASTQDRDKGFTVADTRHRDMIGKEGIAQPTYALPER
jgi:membrane-bound serine protease (ClpP class)